MFGLEKLVNLEVLLYRLLSACKGYGNNLLTYSVLSGCNSEGLQPVVLRLVVVRNGYTGP
jgi:hypothetical protein